MVKLRYAAALFLLEVSRKCIFLALFFYLTFFLAKPQNVSDFKCISSNYENLTCSWTIVPNYVKTSYKLTYTLGSGRLKNSYGCPLTPYPDDNGRMSCFWNLTTTPQYRPAHDLFIFSLTMNNTFGSNVMTIPFHNFENSKFFLMHN